MNRLLKSTTGASQARINQGTTARIKLQCLLPEVMGPCAHGLFN